MPTFPHSVSFTRAWMFQKRVFQGAFLFWTKISRFHWVRHNKKVKHAQGYTQVQFWLPSLKHEQNNKPFSPSKNDDQWN